MNLHVGTSGYSYKEWKGSFYPEKLPAKQMLRHYGERFRAVEINSSFYRMPTASVLEAWAADVPADFRFVLKAPQLITHIRRLKDAEEVLSQFLEVSRSLGQRRGPLLFQLPPNMKKDLARLRDFLAHLPTAPPCAFEFRHASWFDDEVFDLLRARDAALCIAEADDGVDVPFTSTAGWGYVRLRQADYDDDALAAWLDRMRSQGWRDAFVFFRHEDEGKGPRFASRFLELAGKPSR